MHNEDALEEDDDFLSVRSESWDYESPLDAGMSSGRITKFADGV